MAVAARYVNREVASIFGVTTALLLFVGVGGRMIGYLQEAAIGKITGQTVLVILMYRLPEFLQLIAPFALYIAILLTVGRLHADREMVVLQGAGADTFRLVAWLAVTSVAVVAVVTVLSTYVTPLGKRALETYLADQRAQSQFDTVNPSVFHVADQGNRVTYSEGMSDDRRTLEEVFLGEDLDTASQITVWAESAQQRLDPNTGSQFLVLRDGYRYAGSVGQGDYQILRFAELSQRLDVSQSAEEELDIPARPTVELGNSPDETAELHWRFGLPLACIVGSLLALGVARVKPRQGRFAKAVPGMLLMLVYFLLLLVNRNALAEGNVPSNLGLWMVHGAFAAVAVVLLQRVARPVKA